MTSSNIPDDRYPLKPSHTLLTCPEPTLHPRPPIPTSSAPTTHNSMRLSWFGLSTRHHGHFNRPNVDEVVPVTRVINPFKSSSFSLKNYGQLPHNPSSPRSCRLQHGFLDGTNGTATVVGAPAPVTVAPSPGDRVPSPEVPPYHRCWCWPSAGCHKLGALAAGWGGVAQQQVDAGSGGDKLGGSGGALRRALTRRGTLCLLMGSYTNQEVNKLMKQVLGSF